MTVTACRVAVVPVTRFSVPIWLMIPVAAKLPVVFTVRLLAVPDAAPVTVATVMASVPPSPSVRVTPGSSSRVPGLLRAADAADEPTFSDWVMVTICPTAPRVTAPPALIGPERKTPPVPVICTAPVEVIPATVVLPALEPIVAGPPETVPVTVTPVTPFNTTDPPAVVTEARFSRDAVPN